MGREDNPWESVVSGVVLGDAAAAALTRKAPGNGEASLRASGTSGKYSVSYEPRSRLTRRMRPIFTFCLVVST